mmetsp:Transcript_2226/g.10145  ORF Transcript_2226/g.10145 Transcript_2226/m.10145 type:complete len:232 (+) Transcript_2226:293-988(+)
MRLAPLDGDAGGGRGLRRGRGSGAVFPLGTSLGGTLGVLRRGARCLELLRGECAAHAVLVLEIVLERHRRDVVVVGVDPIRVVVDRRPFRGIRVQRVDVRVVVLQRGFRPGVRVGHRGVWIGIRSLVDARVIPKVVLVVRPEPGILTLDVAVDAFVVGKVVIPLVVLVVVQGDVLLRGGGVGSAHRLGRISISVAGLHLHVSLVADGVTVGRGEYGVEEDVEVIVVLRQGD